MTGGVGIDRFGFTHNGVHQVKRATWILVFTTLVCVVPHAQDTSPISLSITPGAGIPLGPRNDNGVKLYTLGGSAVLEGEYTLPFAPILYGAGLLRYSMAPTLAQSSLSLISFGAGAGISISPLQKVDMKLSVAGGYSLGIYEGKMAGVPFFRGQGRILYALSPSFSLGVGASYDVHLPFYHGVDVSLGLSFNLGAGQLRSKVDFIDIQIDPIFPVLFQY